MRRPDHLVTVVAAPAASTSGVAVVVGEGRIAVVAIAGRLVVTLGSSCLVTTKSTQTSILRVQVRVGPESLLALLSLQRRKAGLSLSLARNAVGRRARSVSLCQRRAGAARLGGIEGLRFLRSHRGLLGDGLALAEARLGTPKDIRHACAERIGSGGGLLALRGLRGAGPSVNRFTARHGLVEGASRCRRRRVVI